MKKIYIIATLSTLAILSSCRKSEYENPDRESKKLAISVTTTDFDSEDAAADSAMRILQRAFGGLPTTGDGSSSSASTRVGDATFDANDSIGIYVHTTTPLAPTGIHTPNMLCATFDATTWSAQGHLSDILKNGTTYYATAYHPYIFKIIDPTVITHSVAADQSTALALSQSDLMHAPVTTVTNPTTSPTIALTFNHLLAKIAVTFAMPAMLDGQAVTGIDRVLIKSVDRTVVVNLSSGATTTPNNKGDIKMCLTAGTIASGDEVTYQAIVVPQTIGKETKFIEIYFNTAAGQRNYAYNIEEALALTKNLKHSRTLVSIGDLCFGSVLDLTDGLAKTKLPLKVKGLKGVEWTLTSPAEWLTLSATENGEYKASITGTGTGADQTIYVNVTANTAMVGNFWEPRAAKLALASKGVSSYYTARQNFYRFDLETSTRKVSPTRSSVGVEGFGANQVWSAASSAAWIKLATNVVYGQGDPKASYGPHNGSLESASLFYQIEANNTDVSRSGTVIFTPTTAGGKGASVTIEQGAASLVVAPTNVMISASAAAGVEVFTVNAPVGVSWKILSASGVTSTSPAVGVVQAGLGTPVSIKATYGSSGGAAISGQIVVAYGGYGATQQRVVSITQPSEYIVVKGTRWATGNLVANGSTGARIGAPTDGGLYFQYGGLIGYKGGAYGDGAGFPVKQPTGYWDNAAAFSANDISITPSGYTSPKDKWPFFENMATGGYGYYYYNTTLPTHSDFSAQPNGKDVALGIGDACAHYLGGAWRLPRYDEFLAIIGNASLNTWLPWSYPLISGKPVRQSSSIAVNGYWFGPNSRTGVPNVNSDLFFSASGDLFYNNGALRNMNDHTVLWTSSVGHLPQYGIPSHISESLGVLPLNSYQSTFGFPVRCVMDEPYAPTAPKADQYIELNGLRWTKGNLVARGTKNCEVGDPGDGGLYFQYGGLIGYKGGGGGDGRGTIPESFEGTYWSGVAAFSSNDVKVVPHGYTKSTATYPIFNNVATGGYGYYYYNTLATNYMDFQSQANSKDVTLGIGDPCAYYLGSPWRMPTHMEAAVITGNSYVPGVYVPWGTEGLTGKFTENGPPANATRGAWFGPNSRSGTPTTNTDLFIPFAGYRGSVAAEYKQMIWEAVVMTSSGFASNNNNVLNPAHAAAGVRPRHSVPRTMACNVRCVSDIPPTPTPPTEAQTVSINGLKWATGNLIANGANGCKVGEATDGGLYFQFGSLVGWTGGASGNGVGVPAAGSPTVPALGISVKPVGCQVPATWNTAWLGDPKSQSAINGTGDPCAYYLGGTWRLPTASDFSSLCNNAPNGSAPALANAAWQASPTGMNFNNSGTKLFMPAAGYRYYSNSLFVNVGTDGNCCSASVLNASSGHYLGFGSGYVGPQYNNYRGSGFPVRCVMDEPTKVNPPTADQVVTINGLKWTKGNLIAAGGKGCKVGAPGDGGLYFQYGGLIGYRGGAYGDGAGFPDASIHTNRKYWNGAAVFSSNDVAVTPTQYSKSTDSYPDFNQVSGGYGYYYYNTLNTKYSDFQTQPNGKNLSLGVGDPCEIYLGSPWRLPKYDELTEVTGITSEGVWDQWSNESINGKWVTNGPPANTTKGGWFGPNSRLGNPTANTDIFIPASGLREFTTGRFFSIGIYGNIRSSSVADGNHRAICIAIGEPGSEYNGVVRSFASRSYGFPVRCVSN